MGGKIRRKQQWAGKGVGGRLVLVCWVGSRVWGLGLGMELFLPPRPPLPSHLALDVVWSSDRSALVSPEGRGLIPRQGHSVLDVGCPLAVLSFSPRWAWDRGGSGCLRSPRRAWGRLAVPPVVVFRLAVSATTLWRVVGFPCEGRTSGLVAVPAVSKGCCLARFFPRVGPSAGDPRDEIPVIPVIVSVTCKRTRGHAMLNACF